MMEGSRDQRPKTLAAATAALSKEVIALRAELESHIKQRSEQLFQLQTITYDLMAEHRKFCNRARDTLNHLFEELALRSPGRSEAGGESVEAGQQDHEKAKR